MNMEIESVLNYVESVPIIDTPVIDVLEAVSSENLPIPPTYNDKDQAVTIGSQITEFTSSVPAQMRPPISNSLLLAQLAANKSIENGGTSTDWYTKYVEVLSNIGWLVEGDIKKMHQIEGTGAEVHKEIIPIVTAALGGAAATALVIPLLNGLQRMNEDNPWIKLFDRESKRAEANQFQICHVSSDEALAPKLVLMCFGLIASQSETQVLFFNISNMSATLNQSQADLSVDTAILEGSKEIIQNKVSSFLKNYIRDIVI